MSVRSIMNNVLGDGARSTMFDCYINFSNDLFPDSGLIAAFVKTAQFPGKSLDKIDLKFKGRTIPMKGQVKYDNTWSCTFYLHERHMLKIAFMDWIEILDAHNMKKITGSGVPAQKIRAYTTDLKIVQNGFDGEGKAATYLLRNCFPVSVTSQDLDYSAVGTILEFTVEFSYSHHSVWKGETDYPSKAPEEPLAAGSRSDKNISIPKSFTTENNSTSKFGESDMAGG